MKVLVYWDTDNEKVDDLPEVVNVPSYLDEEDVSDWLSDEYGYCVYAWTTV